MKPSWEHPKEEITTDKKNRVDDERIEELEKRRLKESEKEAMPGRAQRKKNPG